MSRPEAAPVVVHDGAHHRYEILVDGERVGLTAYRDHGDQRVFYHTEVDDAFAGQGLAGRLIEEALTDVRTGGKRVVPVCRYVAGFLHRHQEFADLADPVSPDVLRWLRGELDRA
ncbi:GNAT family N-acetyltransferase [Streptomyces shenzhenensis]|uniref:GNAT family N-acetyltransferase n=1 Tax=Streptomyces TaxID=1883 RepID=UPI001F3BACDE|nr:GNAT family N-acetyltransferase [Streptomyces shenzhenensis]